MSYSCYCLKNDDRVLFTKYYRSNVEIKNFNVLIDSKNFLTTPIKNKQKNPISQ